MKICGICGSEKPHNEFTRDKYKKDGLNPYCRICTQERNKHYRIKHSKEASEYAKMYRKENREILKLKARIDYYKNNEKRAKQSKNYYNIKKEQIALKRAEKRREEEEKQKNRERQRNWQKNNRSRQAEIVTGWKKRNPQKAACHILVLWAIRSGILIRPSTCMECGKEAKVEAHHDDYLKPLEVKWVCKSCHSIKHRKYR